MYAQSSKIDNLKMSTTNIVLGVCIKSKWKMILQVKPGYTTVLFTET